ncbi:RDD family protein [Bacillus salacetis]|uniref:RDD family protein n=1 Tax=Bacillus salacetis TaxID=2315464 RepID=A0A3A1R0I3_9BACI|nr:RDD family protein [Bacillus salacetis]RIW31864.1 RDD family protein [Bacillus salacetis]
MREEQIDIKTPEYVSLQFRTAGLGSRAAAFLIDQILLTIINILVIVVLAWVLNISSQNPYMEAQRIYSGTIAIVVVGMFVLNWGYFLVYEFFSGGRTLGKKLIGIRVIQENGQSITLLSSFIRNIMRIVDMLPVYYFVGMLMVFFHGKHKRLGDITAGTIVVHERRKKKANKKSAIEKEVASRGYDKDSLDIEESTLRALGAKEWKLLRTYSQRFTHVEQNQRLVLTRQVAEIILPKIGMEVERQTEQELENTLLVLYLKLKDEWEFEL